METYNHSLGDTVQYANLDITVSSFNFTKSYAGARPDANTDNTLLVVQVKVYNPTNKTINLYDSILTYRDYLCEYVIVYNGIEYYDRWVNDADFLRTHESIKPLSTISAAICFQVPQIVERQGKIELKLYDGKTNCKLFHFWELRNEEQKEDNV